DGRSVFAFIGPCRGRREDGRSRQRTASVTGVYVEHSRWVLSRGVGLCGWTGSRRAAPEIAAELWRPGLPEWRIRHERETKVMIRRSALFCAMLSLICAGRLDAQEARPPAPRPITLQEAVQLALKHNHVVRMAAFGVQEKEHTKDVA